jgi:hypothetical protein
MNKKPKYQKGFTAIEVLVIILILLVLGGVGYVVDKNHHKAIGPVTGKWSNYTYVKGNFSVLSPTPSHPPIVMTQTTQSHDGVSYKLDGIAFIANSFVDGEDDVTYSTYPSSAEVPSLTSSLKTLLIPHTYYTDAHLVSSRQITVNGNQVETYEVTLIEESSKLPNASFKSLPNVKVYDTGEFVRDGKVLYQIDATAASNSASYQADAQYFVSSFELLK